VSGSSEGDGLGDRDIIGVWWWVLGGPLTPGYSLACPIGNKEAWAS
jgi:hypothetical protein